MSARKRAEEAFAKLSARQLEAALRDAVRMYNDFARDRDRDGINAVAATVELIQAELRRR